MKLKHGIDLKIQTYHNNDDVHIRVVNPYVWVYTLPYTFDGTVYPTICAKGVFLTSCPADKTWDEFLAPILKVSTSPR